MEVLEVKSTKAKIKNKMDQQQPKRYFKEISKGGYMNENIQNGKKNAIGKTKKNIRNILFTVNSSYTYMKSWFQRSREGRNK